MLEDMYDRLSDEDKRLFVRMAMDDRSGEEILQALQRQDQKIEEIKRKQSWLSDFSSNIAGNAVWDGILWIGGKLLRRL